MLFPPIFLGCTIGGWKEKTTRVGEEKKRRTHEPKGARGKHCEWVENTVNKIKIRIGHPGRDIYLVCNCQAQCRNLIQ